MNKNEIEVRKLKRDFFGSLRGIGPFTEEDKIKGQFEEWNILLILMHGLNT